MQVKPEHKKLIMNNLVIITKKIKPIDGLWIMWYNKP